MTKAFALSGALAVVLAASTGDRDRTRSFKNRSWRGEARRRARGRRATDHRDGLRRECLGDDSLRHRLPDRAEVADAASRSRARHAERRRQRRRSRGRRLGPARAGDDRRRPVRADQRSRTGPRCECACNGGRVRPGRMGREPERSQPRPRCSPVHGGHQIGSAVRGATPGRRGRGRGLGGRRAYALACWSACGPSHGEDPPPVRSERNRRGQRKRLVDRPQRGCRRPNRPRNRPSNSEDQGRRRAHRDRRRRGCGAGRKQSGRHRIAHRSTQERRCPDDPSRRRADRSRRRSGRGLDRQTNGLNRCTPKISVIRCRG